MLLLIILIFLLLTIVNYIIGGKVPIYPAFVFCAVWGINLLLIWLSGDFFYRMSDETLCLFACGALVFSIGSGFARFLPLKLAPPKSIGKIRNRALTVTFLLIIVALPIVIRYVLSVAAAADVNPLLAMYRAGSESNESAASGYGADTAFRLFSNFVTYIVYFSLIAFWELEKSRKRAIASVAMALILVLSTGGRGGLINIVFGVLCMDWLKGRRIRWKFLLGLGIILAALVIMVAVALGKGGANPQGSIAENIHPVMGGLVMYASGGLVGFDRVVRDPSIIAHTWSPSLPFLLLLNKFGVHVELPPNNAEFMMIGPNSLSDNVYTFYFAYIDFGYIGMMCFVLAFGLAITFLYRKAMQGQAISSILYSIFFGGLFMSVFADPFLSTLISWGRLWLVCWVFYSLPDVLSKLQTFVKRLAESNMALGKAGH